jgi:hypothetical protein
MTRRLFLRNVLYTILAVLLTPVLWVAKLSPRIREEIATGEGIWAQIQKNNRYVYNGKLTIKELKAAIEQVFYGKYP